MKRQSSIQRRSSPIDRLTIAAAIAAALVSAPAWSYQYVSGAAASPAAKTPATTSTTATTPNNAGSTGTTGPTSVATPGTQVIQGTTAANPTSTVTGVNRAVNPADAAPGTVAYPDVPTASASVPVRSTTDTLGPDAADKLRTGPVGAAANRSTTTPSLTPDSSRAPLDCRTAGGKSVACPDAAR